MLGFIKTGYGSAQRMIRIPAEGASVAMDDVLLWPLPPEEGVFLMEETRYLRMTPTTVRQYMSPERGPCFGTKKPAELETSEPEPVIYTHRMYGYDLQLVRLDQIRAFELGETEPREDAQPEPDETIWVAAEPVPVVARPIDEPERLLYEVRPSIPLAPGHYAVHWGALDGFMNTEKRLFLFNVLDPEAEPAEEAPPVEEVEAAETVPSE